MFASSPMRLVGSALAVLAVGTTSLKSTSAVAGDKAPVVSLSKDGLYVGVEASARQGTHYGSGVRADKELTEQNLPGGDVSIGARLVDINSSLGNLTLGAEVGVSNPLPFYTEDDRTRKLLRVEQAPTLSLQATARAKLVEPGDLGLPLELNLDLSYGIAHAPYRTTVSNADGSPVPYPSDGESSREGIRVGSVGLCASHEGSAWEACVKVFREQWSNTQHGPYSSGEEMQQGLRGGLKYKFDMDR